MFVNETRIADKFCIFVLFVGTIFFLTNNASAENTASFFEQSQEEALRQKINSIVIDEGSLVSVGMVRASLAFCEGSAFSEEAVTQTVKNLESTGYFQNIKIFKKVLAPDKVDILIKLEEKALLVGYEFEGNAQLSAKKLSEITGLRNVKTVSLHDIRHFKNCIISEYRKLNYLNTGVEVISSISKEQPQKIYLRFELNEGEKVSLKDVKFLGCDSVLESALAATLQTKENWLLGPLWGDGRFSEELLNVDKSRIKRFYNDRGFYKAAVVDTIIDKDNKNNEVTVTFVVDEDEAHKIRFIDISGDEDFSEEELRLVLLIKRGDLYSATKLVDSMERIKNLYGAKGYVFCSVCPQIKPVLVDGVPFVDVQIFIEKGTVFKINNIKISGNTKTRDYVIRRNLSIKDGGLANKVAMDRSLSRVEALGYFEPNLDWKISKVGEDLVNLELSLKEIKTGNAYGTVGFTPDRGSSTSSTKMTCGIHKRNFSGLGWDLGINAEVGENNLQKADFSFFNPAVLGSNFFFKSQLAMNKIAYRELCKVTGGTAPLETTECLVLGTGCYLLPSTARLTLGLELGLSRVDFTNSDLKILPDMSMSNQLLYRDRFKNGGFNWLGVSLGQNNLNHPLYPTSGWKWDLLCKAALPAFNEQYSMLKMEVGGKYFVPVIGKERLIFYSSAKFGIVHQFREQLPIPFKELYLTGGEGSLRGFRWGEASPEYRKFNTPLGGTKELLLQFELITPAAFGNNIDINTPRAYLFYDIGAGWDTPIAYNEQTHKPLITDIERDVFKNDFNLRHTVGFGFRMTYPQPIRIEWGYKLDRKYRSKERPSEWLLSMNMPFDF